MPLDVKKRLLELGHWFLAILRINGGRGCLTLWSLSVWPLVSFFWLTFSVSPTETFVSVKISEAPLVGLSLAPGGRCRS